MNCNCLTEVKDKVTEKIKEPGCFKKPVLYTELTGIALAISGNTMITRTCSVMEITLEGQKKKERMNIVHTYCPFCGVKQEGGAA